MTHDKNGHGISIVSERDLHLPSPAIEILPSQNAHPYKYAGENVDLQGLNIFKLGCGYGLAGIFACLKGASTVHFQDPNAETIRCMTIPNVLANLEHARDRQSRQPESPLTPSRQQLSPDVHFYTGDWVELHTVLSVMQMDGFELAPGTSLSFSEDDFMDGCGSQDGSIAGDGPSSRRSRKLSGSRACERADETGTGNGGYDIILIT
ncbi:putative histidine protein methyltransferase 1 [Cocos nucifera]|uniref:Putative histidine protein methyltransferase 1 n=1 Tax=Cocos nucifera TaxID=13894 RepID=A0A8K0MWY1_COCNU|nr:putative histidine protein methyltransferase 1 [Cocos nucifera]